MGIPITIAVVAVIAGLLVFVATRPSSFRIERSAQIDAPADVVFGVINDLRQWGNWSPYDKRDPAMKKSYEGPPTGPGATYIWSGNDKVGEGRMTIIDSNPGRLVSLRLQFSRPFACDNQVNFIIEPAASGARVTWAMNGKNAFMAKAMSLVMNMDKMVGKDFEQGLANLNAYLKGGNPAAVASC